MNLIDLLNEKAITVNLVSTDKEGVIIELIDVLVKTGDISGAGKEKLTKVLLDREALGSTGIGQGVAVPHGKCDCVKKLVAAFGISRKGVNFGSLDGEPVYIFFLLIAPDESAGPHLKALARISRLLKDRYVRDALKNAANEAGVLEVISQEDKKRI
ncbi:MAG: PTS sugar transporter subunit IIA [Candidatus Omnitrophica bacterium]|nr:PTS sugar transporter subunit IIA [Candidatus Omnitrophota bacterium]